MLRRARSNILWDGNATYTIIEDWAWVFAHARINRDTAHDLLNHSDTWYLQRAGRWDRELGKHAQEWDKRVIQRLVELLDEMHTETLKSYMR